jgi:hypothetical protein
MKKVWLIQFTCIGFLLGVTNINKGISTFKRRADGSRENIAQPEARNEAIKFYNLAIGNPEGEIDAVIGLLKSYYFKGKFLSKTKEHKKIVFNKAKNLADTLYGELFTIKRPIFHFYSLGLKTKKL